MSEAKKCFIFFSMSLKYFFGFFKYCELSIIYYLFVEKNFPTFLTLLKIDKLLKFFFQIDL